MKRRALILSLVFSMIAQTVAPLSLLASEPTNTTDLPIQLIDPNTPQIITPGSGGLESTVEGDGPAQTFSLFESTENDPDDLGYEDETYILIPVDETATATTLSVFSRSAARVTQKYLVKNTTYNFNHIVSGWKTSKGLPRLSASYNGAEIAVFCVEPGVMHETGGNMSGQYGYDTLSAAQIDQLELALMYGFGNNGSFSDDSYVATQIVIWEIVTKKSAKSEIWSALIKNYSGRVKYYDALRKEMSNHSVKPNLVPAANQIGGATASDPTLHWTGSIYQLMLQDQNKVLSKYSITSKPSDLNVSKKDNDLTLTTNNSHLTGNISLVKEAKYGGKTMFWVSSKQDLISGGQGTPVKYEFKAEIANEGQVVIKKEGPKGEPIANTTFELKGPGGTQTVKTNANGEIKLSNLDTGTYTLTEKSVPSPYLVNSTPRQFTIKKGEASTITVKNEVAQGQIEIIKTGEQLIDANKTATGYQFVYSNQPLTNVTFSVYTRSEIKNSDGSVLYPANHLVERVTTNSQGRALSSKLPLGSYYVKEIEAPAGFVIEDKAYDVTLSFKDTATPVVVKATSITNQYQDVQLKLTKVGETTAGKYAPLANVVFGVYLDKALNLNGVSLPAGTQLTTVTTNQSGEASTSLKLPIGSYYVKEISAPSGYIVKDTKYPFSFTGTSQDKLNITIDINEGKVITNDLVRGGFTLHKINEAGKPLAGAVFEVFTKNGELVQTVTTDANGAASLKDLVYGDYYVKEKSAPSGYQLNTESFPFEVKTAGQMTPIKVANQPTELEILKVDESGQPLAGATLQLLDKSGQVYAEWVSTKEAYVLSNLPHGNYTLHEVNAPLGYHGFDDQVITITDAAQTVKVKAINEKTKTLISKKDPEGHWLAGATLQLLSIDGKVLLEWETEAEPLYIDGLAYGDYIVRELKAPAGYQRFEDIKITLDPSKQTNTFDLVDKLTEVSFLKVDEHEKPLAGAMLQVVNQKGDVLEVWESKTEPHLIKGLAAGEYTLVETAAPNGYQLAAPVSFKVTDKPETISVQMMDKLTEVHVLKTDENKKPMPGVQLEIVNEAGAVMDAWTTTEEAHPIHGLPYGNYMVREVKSIEGYTTFKPVWFTVTDEAKVVDVTVQNKPTELHIYKLTEDGDVLVGATLQLINEHKEVVAEWVTEEDPYIITHLPLGVYTLHEKQAPTGYQFFDDITINVGSAPNVITVKAVDKLTETVITKLDPNQKPLKGATLQLLTLKEEVVAEWETADAPQIIKGLAFGDYILREIKAPAGYQRFEDIKITVDPAKKVNTFEIVDELTKVSFLKVDEDNQPLAGATLQVLDAQGEVVETWESTTKPHVIEGLVTGEYTLVETAAPDGFQIAAPVPFTVTDKPETISVQMVDKLTEVHVLKIDELENPMKDVKLEIVNEAGDILDTWTTTNEVHIVKGLLYGTYTIREVQTVEGYTTFKPVTFTVTNEAKTVHVTVQNKPTELHIHKVTDTGEFLAGATLQLLNERDEIVAEWTTTEEPHVITHLPLGIYTLHEKEAPTGYQLFEDMTVEITSNPEVITVEAVDLLTETIIEKFDPEGQPLKGAILQLLTLDEEVVVEWETTEEPQVFKGLAAGEYILRELHAPSGYQRFEDQTVTISAEPGVNTFSGTDQYTKLEIVKVNEKDEPLVGAQLQLVNAEGVVVDTWTSTAEPHVLEFLPHGTYRLEEIEAPAGYSLAEPITFEITDAIETIQLKLVNQPTRVEISKVDDSGDPVVGATLQIVDMNGQVIHEWVSTEEPYVVDGLVYGDYRLEEIQAPEGYTIMAPIPFTVTSQLETLTLTAVNKLTELVVYKVNEANEYLAGATLQLKTEAGHVIEKWQTFNEPYTIKGLAYGTYILEEVEAPRGYHLLKEPITLQVDEKPEAVKITVVNERNPEEDVLPETGLEGWESYALIGLSFVGFASTGVLVYRRRRV